MAGRRRAFWISVAAITLLGGFLRFQALGSGLPHPRTRPDEQPLLQKTALPAQGDFNLRYGVYPSAYVYLCWLWGEAAVRVGHRLGMLPSGDYLTVLHSDPASIYRIDRALSALAGTATVPLLMIIAERSLGSAPAIAAGMLLATNFLHVRDSHTFKPDVMLSLLVVVALACQLPLARRATVRTGMLAGVGVGAAMAAKYPGVLLLVPLYLAAVMGTPTPGWRRLVPGPAFVGGVTAGLVFFLTSPLLLFSDEAQRMLSGTFLVLFPQISPELMPETLHQGAAQQLTAKLEPPGWEVLRYHVTVSLRYGFGVLATALAPVAVIWGLASRRPVTVLASAFVVVWFVVVSLSPHFYARYLTPVVPVLCLLAGSLLAVVASRFRRPGITLALAVVAVVAQPLVSSVAFDRVAGRTDTRVLATRWLSAHTTAGDRVAVYGTYFWPWGPPQMPAGVTLVTAPADVRALEQEGVRYVVTHEHELRFSTVDREQFRALESRLTRVAVFDPAVPGRGGAVFEGADAYYIPIGGFEAVERPGPRIEIYRFQ